MILKNVSYSEQLAIEERMNAGRLGIKNTGRQLHLSIASG
jgi:hypothetical protein